MIMGQKWGFKRWGLALGLFAAATSACDGAADFAKPGQAGAAGESTAGDAGSGGHSRGGGGGLGSGGSLPMGGGGLAGEGGNGGSFAGEGGSLGEAGSGGADDGCEADKASGGVGADPSSLAFDATELQLNDVSLLFPLPQTEQELADGLLTMSAQGARGKLLRESLYSNVDDIFGSQVRPGVGGRPVAPYANLRVVALRLDPCFGTLEPPDSGAGCQNQLRWVVQRELLKCGCPWGRCPTPPTPSPSARVCACPVPSFLLCSFLLSGCDAITAERLALPELRTVPRVEVKRYLGTWYEIASHPQSFRRVARGRPPRIRSAKMVSCAWIRRTKQRSKP